MIDLDNLREKIDQNYRHDIVLLEAFGSNKVDICLWLPSLPYWIALAGVGITSILVSSFPSFVIYKTIISKPKTQSSYIIGYGFLVPFCLCFPHMFFDYFDIRNKHLRYALVFNAVLWLFRTIEGKLRVFRLDSKKLVCSLLFFFFIVDVDDHIKAMHGFAPRGSRVSLKMYMTYFATMGDVLYEPGTHKSTAPKAYLITLRILQFTFGMIALGAYSSYLYHYKYEIFDTDVAMNSFDHSFRDLFSFGHIANNFSMILLLQGYLLVFTLPMSLVANIFFRVELKQYMKNALFDAKSPSDFWGKKWNLLIHEVLKRGVYKPTRLYFSTNTAIICTFFASGLLHEWFLIALVFVHENEKNDHGFCENCYYPDMYGKNLLFFLWNGVIIGIEFLAVHHFPIISLLGKKLPKLLRTMIVLMTALPVAHLMLGDTNKAGFFVHSQMGLPMIVVK